MGKATREARRAQRRAHEAEFGVFCPGVLEVLSIGKGHLTLTVDGSNPDEKDKARRLIEEMLAKGYGIYVETDQGPVRVKRFNPKRMTYLIVDDPPESATPPPPAKRAAKRPLREVPVAGSRSTAVGRTAGG